MWFSVNMRPTFAQGLKSSLSPVRWYPDSPLKIQQRTATEGDTEISYKRDASDRLRDLLQAWEKFTNLDMKVFVISESGPEEWEYRSCVG